MKKILLYGFLGFLLSSCSEHSDYNVINFTGEYRYYSGIAEFYDCKSRVKYFVGKAGIYTDLQEKYLKLGMKDKDDVYVRIKGYLKEVELMDGIDPATVFVPVEFISFDQTRGCDRGGRQGG